MKQVYTTENLQEATARTTYFRGGVLFVGFVVWLVAVTDSFGQNGRQKATWVWTKDAAGNHITTTGTIVKTGSNACAATGSYVYPAPGL